MCYERLEQYRKAGKLYSKILKQASACDPDIAKALVEVYAIMKQPKVAIKELKEILDTKYDENIINLICDLEIQQLEFASCIEMLGKQKKTNFPLDIETKKGYCLARLGRLSEADSCFEQLSKHSVQYYDDLFILAGTLYMDLDQYENALKFFEPLLALQAHNKPSLWFKCGKLYYEIKDYKSAEDAFKSVIETQDPGLMTQSKLYLSKIYKNLGEVEKSIQVLKTKNIEIEDNIEVSDEVIVDLVSNAKLKIEESWIRLDLDELMQLLSDLVETELRLEVRKREDLVSGIGAEALYEAFVRVVDDCVEKKKFSLAKEFIVKLLKMNMFKDGFRLEMKKKLTRVCVLDLDFDQAINSFKFVCEKEGTDSNWIVMSALMRKAEKPLLRSWLCKMALKFPLTYPVHMLLGNSYFQTGNYALGIKQYLQVYSISDPVVNLQLGLSHLFSLCSRNLQKKDETFEKAFRYLKLYVKTRKRLYYFEAYFNLARAYHHILFYSKATYYYEKILRYSSRSQAHRAKDKFKYIEMTIKNLITIRLELNDISGAKMLESEWEEALTQNQ